MKSLIYLIFGLIFFAIGYGIHKNNIKDNRKYILFALAGASFFGAIIEKFCELIETQF